MKNLFTGAMAPPNLLDLARKLNNLVEASVKLPKKGAKKISISSETAADIKTLAVRLLELAEFNNNIPALRQDPFSAEDDEQQVQRLLAGANAFGCKVPDILENCLDQMTKTLERIEQATMTPAPSVNINTPGASTITPLYALAALKHAPEPTTTSRQVAFKPTSVRKTPTAPPPAIKPKNTLTLAQTVKEGKV